MVIGSYGGFIVSQALSSLALSLCSLLLLVYRYSQDRVALDGPHASLPPLEMLGGQAQAVAAVAADPLQQLWFQVRMVCMSLFLLALASIALTDGPASHFPNTPPAPLQVLQCYVGLLKQLRQEEQRLELSAGDNTTAGVQHQKWELELLQEVFAGALALLLRSLVCCRVCLCRATAPLAH